ncbi:hypothetical protein PRIPAC_96640 [Pristionchus pacificus]|uniref:Uncharacterized protein n=1 Tax=Pristionchus pacificus TaxID=54126 RepID=A0A454XRE7_PRIPA|nr:hypothetical protein PRIPAC_96640 [Pristionchus pacificus]|eukprot:PDM77376.1 hypothetical protein PRIPAC_33106 [Pristionchus pacificus]
MATIAAIDNLVSDCRFERFKIVNCYPSVIASQDAVFQVDFLLKILLDGKETFTQEQVDVCRGDLERIVGDLDITMSIQGFTRAPLAA